MNVFVLLSRDVFVYIGFFDILLGDDVMLFVILVYEIVYVVERYMVENLGVRF